MVADFGLDALAYYYHGADGNDYEQLQSGFIVGHSLLTARGVPCAGEGDLKTALAMTICDLLGVGGSFCEIVTTDYLCGTILMGHDGPFHLAIAKGRPILRGLGLYHGKRGSGVICLNGAAARKAQVGDTVIIIAYALMDEKEAKANKPKVVMVDEHNHILSDIGR